MALFRSGQIDECIRSLSTVWREPRFRFEAAATIARIFRRRGETTPAIEWFERAADAEDVDPDQRHILLLELADILEAAGEESRALAVCLELRVVAGEFHDV